MQSRIFFTLGLLGALLSPMANASFPPRRPVKMRAKIPDSVMVPVDWAVAPGQTSEARRCWIGTVHVGSASLPLYAPNESQARADAIRMASRFDAVGAHTSQLQKISLGHVAGTAVLMWGPSVLWPVTTQAARDYGRPADEVVATWVDALRKVRPGAGFPSLRIPAGDAREIGVPPGWTLKTISDKDVVTVQASGSLLDLHGVRAGHAMVVLAHGALTRPLDIQVEALAGVVPYRLGLSVSGPYQRMVALAGLERLLDQRITLHSGAEVTAYWDMLPSGPVDDSTVTMWAEGPDLAAQVRNCHTAVRASSLRVQDASHLVASNNPEVLLEEGVLADQVLPAGTSWYYYHHQNDIASGGRTLQVVLVNQGTGPAHLLVSHSGAGPTRDEIYVGHVATWRFLQWSQAGQGWEVDIPPGGSYVLDDKHLAGGEVSAGLGLIQVEQGTDLHFVTRTKGGGTVEDPRANQAVRARGLYPAPHTEQEATYAVKGPWAFVALGGPPYAESGDSLPNPGNYGVLNHLKLHLSNPTDASERVFVVFAAGGGPARGSLRIDGQFKETPVVGANVGQVREAPLADYTLEPGQSRDVDLLAIPEPGSNYPVRIIVKSIPANR